MTKQKFDMSDLAKKLKYYIDENARFKKENEKLMKENDQLVGHKNPSQKIQHHVRIKEENNRLREENVKLQDDLRRYIDQASKMNSPLFRDEGDFGETETTSKIVDLILSQPNILKSLGISNESIA